jgi:predicted amidophosphoribosyltransferase
MTSGQDAKDCREAFRPIVARRRTASRIVWIAVLPALCFWLLGWTERDRRTGAVGFFVCLAILFIGAFTLPKLVCPACHHKAEQEPEHYCPECGAADLHRNFGFFSIARCRSCGKKLVRGKGGRRYKIRFCTVCGAHLDDAGV